jgi:hypothetical protein
MTFYAPYPSSIAPIPACYAAPIPTRLTVAVASVKPNTLVEGFDVTGYTASSIGCNYHCYIDNNCNVFCTTNTSEIPSNSFGYYGNAEYGSDGLVVHRSSHDNDGDWAGSANDSSAQSSDKKSFWDRYGKIIAAIGYTLAAVLLILVIIFIIWLWRSSTRGQRQPQSLSPDIA